VIAHSKELLELSRMTPESARDLDSEPR